MEKKCDKTEVSTFISQQFHRAKKRIKREQKTFKEIRTRNLPQLKKELTLQTESTTRVPKSLNKKKPLLDII